MRSSLLVWLRLLSHRWLVDVCTSGRACDSCKPLAWYDEDAPFWWLAWPSLRHSWLSRACV